MLKDIGPAIRTTIVLAILTGVVYPLVLFGIGQTLFPKQANGSLIMDASGRVIGSALIAQPFIKPEYFHPRPSAAGAGYAGEASSGSNLGPTSKKLFLGDKDFAGIKQLAEAYRKDNFLKSDDKIPVDAITRSGSGLDPQISPANARIQAVRVANARGMPVSAVTDCVEKFTDDRQFGFLGEPRVNVLQLNLALDAMKR
jgi:K+-transporting ATPase ATPase C chain